MPSTEATTPEAPPSSGAEALPSLPKHKFTLYPRDIVNWLARIAPYTTLVGFPRSFTLDVLPDLGSEFASETIMRDFDQVWLQYDPRSRNALARACFRASFWLICVTAVPRIMLSGFSLAAPSLVYDLLEYLSNPETSSRTPLRLFSMTIVVFGGQAASTALHGMLANRMTIFLRAILVSKVSAKNVNLQSTSETKSKMLSLIDADVETLLGAGLQFHNYWLSTVEFGVSLYLLSRIVGNAAFLCLLPLFSLIMIVWQLTWRLGRERIYWNKATKMRISKTTEMLCTFTSVKMMSIELKIGEFLKSLRSEELIASKAAKWSIVRTVAALPLNFWFGPIMIIYGGIKLSIWNKGLEPLTVFPVLAYLEVTSDAISDQTRVIPQIEALLASFARIQDFLALEERKDERIVRDFTNGDESSMEKSMPSTDSKEQDTCLSIEKLSVVGHDNTTDILKDFDLHSTIGTLTMVTGPVGSGKSLLLKTILGETVFHKGKIEIADSKLAYCGQDAWLPDVPIKAVIIGDTPFEKAWYDDVLIACELESDLKLLPDGDNTLTRSSQVKLTKSQRQRIVSNA